LDLKSNLKCDLSSVIYFIELISFFAACYIGNKLYNRCNSYENIYIIELNEYAKKDAKGNIPEREQIYEKCERQVKNNVRQYYGVFIFFALGLFCIIFSNILQKNQSQESEKQNTMFQKQIDTLQIENDTPEVINIEQTDESIME
jgi:hypothetical protein